MDYHLNLHQLVIWYIRGTQHNIWPVFALYFPEPSDAGVSYHSLTERVILSVYICNKEWRKLVLS